MNQPVRECCATGPHQPHAWFTRTGWDDPTQRFTFWCPGVAQPLGADEWRIAVCQPVSPHYEKDPPMPRYLSETDRRNLHLLVHNERLVELRRYAKALLAVVDERRRMDPNRRPITDALSGFNLGRDVPNVHLVEITPSVLTQLRGYIATLKAQHHLDDLDDPYLAVYTSDADLAALYYLVETIEHILPKPDAEPIVVEGGWTAPRGGVKMFPTPDLDPTTGVANDE